MSAHQSGHLSISEEEEKNTQGTPVISTSGSVSGVFFPSFFKMHFDHEENHFLQDLVFMVKMKIHPLLPLLESWARASVPHSLGLVLYSSQPNMFSQESEKRLEFNETNQFIDILTTGIV